MAEITRFIEPATLYRYRSLEKCDREVDAIASATLYCAPYSELNDPMEGYYDSSKKLRESIDYPAFKAMIADNKATLGICSFSEVHNNEVMWAHYADEFRGICIAYSFPRLLTRLETGAQFVRVDYRDRAPHLLSGKEAGYLAKRVLSCKSFRWLYEREWRMFSTQRVASYKYPKAVQCVYLGFRIDPHHRTKIEARMKSHGIRTSRMSLDRYTMEFERAK
jgi:hypothetical protein